MYGSSSCPVFLICWLHAITVYYISRSKCICVFDEGIHYCVKLQLIGVKILLITHSKAAALLLMKLIHIDFDAELSACCNNCYLCGHDLCHIFLLLRGNLLPTSLAVVNKYGPQFSAESLPNSAGGQFTKFCSLPLEIVQILRLSTVFRLWVDCCWVIEGLHCVKLLFAKCK